MTIKHTFIATALLSVVLPGALLADEEPQETVLRAAQGGEPLLTQLIKAGTPIDATDDDGETALMKASDKGLLDTVQVLIKHGADVNRADEDGKTPLMFAAEEGHTEVVKALLKAGAHINARDEDGETALDMAEDEDHPDTAAALRAAGAANPE